MISSRREFLCFLAAACTGCAGSPAGERWTASRLERADALAKRYGGKGWVAWKGGRQVAAWNPEARDQALSLTKCLAALAATKAMEEGWLSDQERAAAAIPEWQGDPRKMRITVSMLLQQTAGLEAGVAALYRNPDDKGRAAVALRAVDEPGTVFRYGPASWELLAELMRRKLSGRGETLEKFLHRAVMRPIGLSSPDWRSDKKGRFFLSTGAEMTVSDLGRLGRTVGALLRGESTAGFDAAHFARMTRPSAVNPIFGGGIWRNSNAGSPGAHVIEVEDALDPPRPAGFWQRACLSRDQPSGMVALVGSSGRRVFIWPGEDKVVARLGRASSWRDGPFLAALGR